MQTVGETSMGRPPAGIPVKTKSKGSHSHLSPKPMESMSRVKPPLSKGGDQSLAPLNVLQNHAHEEAEGSGKHKPAHGIGSSPPGSTYRVGRTPTSTTTVL